MRLRSRITLILIAFGCLPVLVVGVIATNVISNHLEDQAVRALEAVAASKQIAARQSIAGWKQEVLLIASRTRMRTALREFNNGDVAATPVIQRIINDAQRSTGSVLRIEVIDLSGRPVATVGEVATSKESGQVMLRPGDGPDSTGPNLTRLYETADGYPAVRIMTPLQLDGAVVGQLAVVLRADELVEIASDYTGLGETGETIVATRLENGDALFVTPLRHDADAAMMRTIARGMREIPVTRAIENTEVATYEGFVDYRRVPVLVATRGLPELNGGIVAKIDRAEADASVQGVKRLILVIGGAAILAAALLGLVMATWLVRPVHRIGSAVHRIRDGDFETRVSVLGNDELAVLGNDINDMAEHLEQSTAKVSESEERFRTAFENAAVGMALVSTEGRLLRVNRALCEMLDYSTEELLQKDFQAITHKDDLDQDLDLVRRTLEGEIDTYAMNKRYIARDGKVVFIRLNVSLMRDRSGQPLHFVSQMEDITEEYEAKALLETTVRKLQNSNRELEDFAYTASHDLKEPLRTLSNFSNFLAEDYADKIDEDGNKMLVMMREAASRLESLIDVLLRYSRAGRGGLRRQPVNIVKILEEMRIELGAALEEGGVELRFADDFPAVQADPTLLAQIFQNLVSNAIRYRGDDNPWVKIGFRDANPPLLYVQDNGIGIPPEHHDKVFRIFKRLHARTEYGGGHGAGLTITKKLVELHGGEIWVESESGQGTSFCFTLDEPVADRLEHDISMTAHEIARAARANPDAPEERD